jgi:hypothetical protein
MRTKELFLRCFAEKKGDLWQAFCLDLNLAAQGDTSEEARRKLHAQIAEYVYDALAGPDQEYADQLLKRPAPASIRARYYFYNALFKVGQLHNGVHLLFKERLPLVPANIHVAA